MAEITPRAIEWLWRPFLQTRAINLLTGDPSSGKSTICCDLAAALSSGRPLPGDPPGVPRPPVNTWIMNGEDAADDTIVWRLRNQGADPTRVLVTDQARTIDAALAREIGRTIAERAIRLVVIDPLQAWMGSDVDMNRANETREWAGHLRRVALETGCAIIFVRHRRKGQPGDNALYSGLGSIDISGFARCESGAIVNRDGSRYLTRIKGNVGPNGDGLRYTIEPSAEAGNDHGILKWTGTFVEAAAIRTTTVPRAHKLAVQWLQDYLKEGPKPALALLDAAVKRGISERTLRRAKRDVAESIQLPNSEWIWQLMPSEPAK